MRTNEGYEELSKKYQFSLSILKEIKPKIYNQIMQTIELLNRGEGYYSDLIRNLRIDYAQSNDHKLAETPRVVRIDRGLYHEVFSMSYSPENDYTLGFMYVRNSKIASKRIFVEIVPATIEESKDFTIDIVLRISKLDNENKATKIIEYYAGYTDTTLEVFSRDLDKPDQVISVLSVDKDYMNEFVTDEITF